MANNNSLIVHLNGDSSNLENAINSTRKSIADLQRSGNKIEDIQKSFDKVSNSTMPLRRKIAEIKKVMEQMAVEGIDTTEEGKAMWQKLSEAAQQYDATLKKIQQDTRQVGEESSGVKPISSEGGIDLKGIGTDLLNKSGLGNVGNALGSIASMANPATLAIGAVGGTMIAAGKATAEFETHLNSLQALTGLTDNEMKAVNDGAIGMSKNFRSSASEIVDAMKLIGSQAPELLKDSDALMKVTEAANVLSEAAEISVEDAAKAITGTMNQMGVSASNATDIINTFAAASQQGSADVAYLNKAFEKSGTAAASAGMDYVELASAIEAVAPKFSSADVAGSQLASTLLKLSMSGINDFMPSVVGMSQALENLAKAEMDDVAMNNLVGESNITMLKSLIQARDTFDGYSESLRGTNTAYEQMEINQKGFQGSINKLKSAWDAFLLTLGQSGIMEGITDNIIMLMNAINEVINIISNIIKSFEEFSEISVDSINPLKNQLEVLIDVIKMVGEIVEVVVRFIAKAFNEIVDVVNNVANSINDKWQDVKKSLGDIAFVRAIINAFNKVLDAAANMCNQIKKYWNKLKEFLGMKVETNVEEKVKHTDANIETNTTNNSTNSTSSSNDSKSKSTKSKSSKTEKIDYLVSVDDGSLDVAEKKLNAWNNKKKTIKIDDVEGLKKCDEEIKKWQNEVNKRKLIIQFGNEIFDNLNNLQSKLSELENRKEQIEIAIKSNNVEELNNINDSIKSLSDKSINIEVEIDSNKEELDNINSQLNALQSKKIDLEANGSVDEIKAIESEINALEDKKINISCNIDKLNKENNEIKTQISQLESKKSEIELIIDVNSVNAEEQINDINKRLDALKSKKIEIMANGSTDELEAIRNEITSLTSQRNVIELSVTTDTSKLTELNKEIDELKNSILIETIKIGFKPEIEKGSVTDLENEIKKLEDVKEVLFQTKAAPSTIKQVEDEIKNLKFNLEQEEIRLGIKPKIENGSINSIKKKIKDKEEEIALALNTDISPESMKKLQTELEALRKEEEAKEIELGVKVNTPTISKEETKFERGSVDDKRQSMDNAKSMVGDIQTNFRLGLIGKEDAINQINEINNKLQELGLNPIEIDVNSDRLLDANEKLEQTQKQMQDVSSITSSVGSVFGSLGSAIGGATGEVMNFAGQSINAVAQIIPQIVALIGAKEAEAMASGTASASSMPFPANIAAIASIIATIAGVFASLPKFESGGIVGGSSFVGDKLLARVNSGEMILNKKQQRNLYNTMDNSVINSPRQMDVNVIGKTSIKGSDINMIFKNYENKMSRIK